MKRSLITKYFLVTAVVILMCMTILGSALMVFVSNYWKEEKTKLLYENVSTVSEISQQFISSGDMEGETEKAVAIICSNLKLISEIINADIFVCDVNGKVIMCKDMISAKTGRLVSEECDIHSNYEMPQKVLDQTKENGEFVEISRAKGETGKQRYFIVGKTISVGKVNYGYVFASETVNESLRPYITEILKMFAVSAVVAMFIAFVAIYALVFKYTKPLRDMATATKKYAEGDFSYRVEISAKNELNVLSEAFNKMANDLATLEASRRSFVANVSHELKTPMTTIGGFIDGILDGTIPRDKQDYYLQRVSDEVKRLSRLVVEMLNMSKIEAGELKLNKTDFNISKQIFDVLLSFEQKIEEKGISIEGISDIQSMYINADEDMIHQVVYNLVDNAVKFTQKGGTIKISAAQGDGKVVVSIKNTGDGISPEDIGRIFERFYKTDKSRSMDVKGTGLGLYLVKSIIEMHSGGIKALSEQGEYTEIVFWLPTEG